MAARQNESWAAGEFNMPPRSGELGSHHLLNTSSQWPFTSIEPTPWAAMRDLVASLPLRASEKLFNWGGKQTNWPVVRVFVMFSIFFVKTKLLSENNLW